MRRFFPGMNIRYEKLADSHKMVLPYFDERLKTGKLNHDCFPFYKIYVDGSRVEEVGSFFGDRREIAYYHECDWLVRIYIEFGLIRQAENLKTTPLRPIRDSITNGTMWI